MYLTKLINNRDNGIIKIITGIRRCGKSYLLDTLFKEYLMENNVKEDHIIKISLDTEESKIYRNSKILNEYIRSKIVKAIA